MFIDFLTLLLVNMTAGFVLLAAFVYRGLDATDRRHWAPGFAIVGIIALVFGGAITLHWPLPSVFNMVFGEMSVLFGIIFLATAVALALQWSLLSVAVYAFFAGLAAVVLGVGILSRDLTQRPLLSAAGFLLSGLAGLCAAPVLYWFGRNRMVRTLAALVLLATAGIWALTGYGSYWMHLESFARYMPR